MEKKWNRIHKKDLKECEGKMMQRQMVRNSACVYMIKRREASAVEVEKR